MKLYFSKSHSDEEGFGEEAKLGMVFASKEEIIKICDFFIQVKSHIKNNDNCHMHLRDNFEGWNKENNFDVEVNLE
jgi:hypothetical protein